MRPHSAQPSAAKLALRLRRLAFDEQLMRLGVAQILGVGDCHGGRTVAHLSTLVKTHFIYGCMHR